jgi:hypothetical protein
MLHLDIEPRQAYLYVGVSGEVDQQARVLGQFPEEPKIAILAAPHLMDPGRLTQTVATNRGARVRASESLQELLSWLAD